jgi:hypothetical protein
MISHLATLALVFGAFTASAKGETVGRLEFYKNDSCTTAMTDRPVSMFGMVGSSGCFGYCYNLTEIPGGVIYRDLSFESSERITCYPYLRFGCNNTVPHTHVRASLDYIDTKNGRKTVSMNGACQNTNLAALVTREFLAESVYLYDASIQCFMGDCEGVAPI